jgi:CBS domain containing-hemolysin-like protein
LLWIASLFFLLVAALFSAARSALVNARRARLQQMAESGVRGAARAVRVAEDSSRLLATVHLARTLTIALAIACATAAGLPELSAWLAQWPPLQPYAGALALLLLGAASGLVLLILGDLVPGTLAARRPEGFARVLATPVDLLATALRPLVGLIAGSAALITVPSGGAQGLPLVTEEEIRSLVDAGEEQGVIEQDEKAMIDSVLEFADTMAREVMVPRVDIVALAVATPLPEAVDAIIASGHSRVPVYEDSIDNIVGLVYAKDLLREQRRAGANRTLRELLRPAHFVPEAKKIDELLKELQLNRMHMAVVVDEYGGVAGVVTVEDILEELVGELQDEYDLAEEPVHEQIGPDEYLFAGRVGLDEVAERLNTWLDPQQGDTLGGFLYSQLGKVPVAGEKLVVSGLEMEILAVNRRRIEKVRVRRTAGEPTAPEPPPA